MKINGYIFCESLFSCYFVFHWKTNMFNFKSKRKHIFSLDFPINVFKLKFVYLHFVQFFPKLNIGRGEAVQFKKNIK